VRQCAVNSAERTLAQRRVFSFKVILCCDPSGPGQNEKKQHGVQHAFVFNIHYTDTDLLHLLLHYSAVCRLQWWLTRTPS
jgi:hypothetical protein